MGWRRLLAVATVLASGGTALALQVWPMGSPPAESNPAIPINANGRIVFSLRNNTSTSTTVTSFFGSGSDCMQISSPVPLDPGIQTPWTIAANEQMQFKAETAGFSTPGSRSCTWSVSATGGTATASATFHVVSSEDVDVQPTSMSFGPLELFDTEQQSLVITGWQSGSADVLVTITSGQGRFELIGCGSNDSCQITLPGSGGFGSAVVQCNASTTGSGSGQILVRSTDMNTTYGDIDLLCDVPGFGSGIVLDPMILSQSAPVGMTDTDTIDVMGPGSLTNVSITSNLGAFTIQECGGLSSCSLNTPLSTTLHIVCTPMSATDTGTLAVSGTAGSASASLQCAPALGSPVLSVSDNDISFDDTTVFATDTETFQIENGGGGTLTNVTLSLGTGNEHFSFSDCDEVTPCTVMSGIPKVITVTFQPQSHDFKMSQLTVTADGDTGSGSGSGSGPGSNVAQTEYVLLSGTGIGGIMVVTSPMASESYVLDLGSVPLNAEGSAQIRVRNDGNALITATVTGNSAPYTLLSNSDVIAGGGSDAAFDVRCSSSTPSLSNDQTWTISDTGAYAGAPQDITVRCSVADTNVVVDPLSFDFGEVRTGTPARSVPLTVTNPGPGSTMLSSMKLRAPRTGLSLTPNNTTTSLAAGAVASASLKLETAEDSDLTGEFVDIEVGSATLSLPVRGKVVTARSRIAPEKLDLGTACVGSVANGTVRLINNGTATVGVDAPEIDVVGSFVAATPGTLFPASLVPTMDIAAQIAPSVSAAGLLTGTLTWRDDVPSVYEVPITLEYVSSGTALSPRGLDFGGVAVDALTISQSVMLENCDDAPAKVTVKSVRGIKGPIGAWVLEPRVGFTRMLASHERQAILVTFQPPGRGHYEAEIVVETASGQEKILLVGDATGRDFGNTSFYTCACSTPGAPWGAWPIALVVVAISARRRRGSSSAR